MNLFVQQYITKNQAMKASLYLPLAFGTFSGYTICSFGGISLLVAGILTLTTALAASQDVKYSMIPSDNIDNIEDNTSSQKFGTF